MAGVYVRLNSSDIEDNASESTLKNELFEHSYLPDSSVYKSDSSKRRICNSIAAGSQILAGLLLFIVGTVLGAHVFNPVTSTVTASGVIEPSLELLGERNRLVPSFASKLVTFRNDATAVSDHRTELSRNNTKKNWRQFMPDGNGFIEIMNPSIHTLPPPIELPDGKTVYSLAVFHELHCLYMIMDRYDSLLRGDEHDHDSHHRTRDEASSGLHEGSVNHVDHCFNYLRQAIMCSGDTALEGQAEGIQGKGTDGNGATHVCKDFDAILTWAQNKRVTDETHL